MSGGGVAAAVRDLERHTLDGLPGALAKLVYLASTRDYDTAEYHHAGLEQIYTSEGAQKALRQCHASIFATLAGETLEALVGELESYLAEKGEDSQQVLKAWRGLEPYRMLVPAGCDARMRDLFISNFTTALSIVHSKGLPLNSQMEPQSGTATAVT